MKRLSELDRRGDPRISFAADLVSSMDPLADSTERMARVRSRLAARRALRGPRYRMPAAFAFALLIGLVTVAGATAAQRYWGRRRVSPSAPMAPCPRPSLRAANAGATASALPTSESHVSPHSPPRFAGPHGIAPALASPSKRTAGAADRPSVRTDSSSEVPPPSPIFAPGAALSELLPPVRDTSPIAAPVPVAAPGAVVSPPAAPVPAVHHEPPAREEAALVEEALRALRSVRDPARATLLLDDYLRRFPNGALAEDALALAIEAALGHDEARVRRRAVEYLQRFPAGAFVELARRVLDDESRLR